MSKSSAVAQPIDAIAATPGSMLFAMRIAGAAFAAACLFAVTQRVDASGVAESRSPQTSCLRATSGACASAVLFDQSTMARAVPDEEVAAPGAALSQRMKLADAMQIRGHVSLQSFDLNGVYERVITSR